ncbi:S8 family serine peptidase [Streptomyces sp. WAC 00631]|uniref:S8 family serine peptidase n=1 Tax=Streptomyces sp. WAC 00631 TaxID=2203201 RepID=UPI000F7AFA0D|nr:S8 family serine peptidase [Streptomyces sp. WAC 00631]MCC5037034.1 S8 family serine peptidase [Streptomyces sp. WAC 00631]
MNHYETAAGRGHRGRPDLADAGISKTAGEYTDRFLVLLAPGAQEEGMATLRSRAGTEPAERIRPDVTESTAEVLEQAGSVVFEDLGVAVVQAAPDQRRAVMETARDEPAVLAVERERVLWASQLTESRAETATADYLRGYHDGVEELVQHALERIDTAAVREPGTAGFDESLVTWGLQAAGVPRSAFSGQGVRVAVLDTGVDTGHPDLTARLEGAASFVPGQAVQDGHGHGTHCVGTSCGPRTPGAAPRYGVACEAEIYAGKVLGDGGGGTDTQILAGMNWAFGQGCRVISMSLGSPVGPGERPSRVYEQIARRLMRAGTLVVAAAGNESERPHVVEPVGHPANCPSVLAVGALDSGFAVASFSNAGLNPDGGQIDIAAPGVDVLSSWPQAPGHRRLRGTSMATPHVAGAIALFAEAAPRASAAELKSFLLAGARRLPLPAVDVGAGLLQAP